MLVTGLFVVASCANSATPGRPQPQGVGTGMYPISSIRQISAARFHTSSTIPSPSERNALDIGGALPATTMNIIWRVIVGSFDSMDTSSSAERDEFTSQGQFWYVPATNIAGTAPIYRERRSSPPQDHMASNVLNESGYIVDGPVCYGYSSALPGTAELLRYLDASNGDHATAQPGEAMSGYTLDSALPFWGYPRFMNNLTSLATLSSGGITVSFNKVMGGVIWGWTNAAGFQYVDTSDEGREIQGAFFYSNENPTEAGDGAPQDNDVQDKHGSPTTTFSSTATTLSSRTIPLDFNPANFGASGNQVVAYTSMILGHDVTMNYDGLGAVVKYTSWLTLPQALGGSSYEIPTAYLNSGLSVYRGFDAAANAATAPFTITPASCGDPTTAEHTYEPTSGYGGVIVAGPGSQTAFGEYGVMNAVGGPVSYFSIWNLSDCPGPVVKTDAVATGSFPGGTTSYDTYLISGTLKFVEQTMRTLYTSGAR